LTLVAVSARWLESTLEVDAILPAEKLNANTPTTVTRHIVRGSLVQSSVALHTSSRLQKPHERFI